MLIIIGYISTDLFRVIIPESLMETEVSATNFECGTDLFVQNILAQKKSIVKKMDSD